MALQTTELTFWLVGPGGIEPPTSPLSGVRSSHLSYGPRLLPANTGGAGRDRTGDLLNANQALSQLSYSPLNLLLLLAAASSAECCRLIFNRGQLDTETISLANGLSENLVSL